LGENLGMESGSNTDDSAEISVERKPIVSIHYCPGCRWLTRSVWMAQELLDTFGDDLHSLSLNPSEQSGTFQIYIDSELIWDRRQDDGFPQIKDLKRRVRDMIAPERELGHLDR